MHFRYLEGGLRSGVRFHGHSALVQLAVTIEVELINRKRCLPC